MLLHSCLPIGIGLGLKVQHVDQILRDRPALAFFEVHAENYMVAGGPFHQHLGAIREGYALSLHGVGLSLGGEQAPDPVHLVRLRELLGRYQPEQFSEHLAWCSHGPSWFNDLLPLAYTPQTLQRICDHIDQTQNALGRRMLIENPSTYLGFRDSNMSETDFLRALVARTGCGLLLDVNNLYVSAVNHGLDAGRCLHRLLDGLAPNSVGEIHLAGFAEDQDAAGECLLIDNHGSPVAAPVWALYQQALRQLGGPVPTLIERDKHIPALSVLLGEAAYAAHLLAASCNTPQAA